MSVHRVARELYERLFSSLKPASESETGDSASNGASSESKPEPCTEVFLDEEPSTESEPANEEASEFGEFANLLEDLGAESGETGSAELMLKDLTIDALHERLKDLRGIGDELAETEQARLAGNQRIAELELTVGEELEALREENADLRDRISGLENELEKGARAHDRVKERLEKMRVKFEDRKKAAADRWREIQRLKREHREKLKELRSK